MSETNEKSLPHRTKLPSPMVPRNQISIWSILKNCIGKELYKITMPVVFNEPLTMLQRACESIQHVHYLKQADCCDDPVERIELVCTFIVASLAANSHRIIKPFNPLLYETYEFVHHLDDGTEVKAIAQQVSHHPPITASHAECQYFTYHGSVNPKIKFWGRTIEIQPDGHCRIYLKRHKENYIFKSVSCSVHNIIVGKPWFEHTGPLDVKCQESGCEVNLNFKQTGWFSNELHRFDGQILNPEKQKVRYIYGKWSDYIKSMPYQEYLDSMKSTISEKDSKTLWQLEDRYLADYYNFTLFTLRMNELTPELEKNLPRTDTRFRPDVRKLEEGDLVGAANEKERLEEKQRAKRAVDKRFKEPSLDYLWFEYKDVDFTKEKLWMYRGGYWENKCNVNRFPDLF